MAATPQFSYFLSHSKNPVSQNRPIWQKTIPLTRKHFEDPLKKGDAISITHGDYFQAARFFLEQNDFEMITRVLSKRLQQDIETDDLKEIRIFLEKHGEFYHPSRIEAVTCGKKISLVLNVAISESGKAHIKGEYQFLEKLGEKYPASYLPQVYGRGEVDIEDTLKVRMLLGEWFDEYYEFHISRDKSDKKDKIIVWDTQRGNFFLSADQSLKLYALAARILTHFYDLESFAQIFPWHHAAGDFVVKVENNKIDLKLITVRRYASIFKSLGDLKHSENDAELILQAMLVFLLNLSIRMRLDRRDGAGDIVWADESAVLGTLIGFLEGLALKPHIPMLPDSPDRCFEYYLSLCTEADLLDLSLALLNSFNPKAEEVSVIKPHLKEHVETLYRSICQYNASAAFWCSR
ncbi:MAG: hypothetical protein JSV31_05650 [Desulfobacterales bacterium]|nr:MAG: hypothetical protein JSV31_05650 [Desulfobacterales bacterium]